MSQWVFNFFAIFFLDIFFYLNEDSLLFKMKVFSKFEPLQIFPQLQATNLVNKQKEIFHLKNRNIYK